MARAYESRAGRSPVTIPATVFGPQRETWSGLATATLKLVNDFENLEALGVDPSIYKVDAYGTVGDYLDQIRGDFVELTHKMITDTLKPVRLVVAFASGSGKGGILGELSSGHRYGSLDPHRLLDATPKSEIGRWWSERVGQLVQAIVRLDARATYLAPSLSVPVVNRYGPDAARSLLRDVGSNAKTPGSINTYFRRADFGRLLLGTAQAASETRGNPAADAAAAFDLLASTHPGFQRGTDKLYNQAVGAFLAESAPDLGEVLVEKRSPFLPLIPDLSIVTEDLVTCVELHWRKGDFLTSAHRSDVAQYILDKIRSYATELGWLSR